RIAGAVLETHRDTGALGSGDQRLSRPVLRIAGILLVAVEHDGDVHAIEYSGVFQRTQCMQHDDVTTLHVDDARTARGAVVESLESLKWVAGLEYRVEVSDQKYL